MPQATIAPCLWFDHQAQQAAQYYVGIFPNSRIVNTLHYGEAGKEVHGRQPGSVLTVEFELDGQLFTALNGGPVFKFNEALSLQVDAPTQERIDYYWEKLGADGDKAAQQCGWLKDKYGVSWQVYPFKLSRELFSDPDDPKSQAAFAAMMEMKKIDIAALRKAYDAG
ncbi:MAG: 3-demethylubiquinone-9 3-methyltransferase [Fibrobacteria bacterium]|jgi:predicted 3-demethylubiquinone-9 3-methyltransferase (glyoxalase superfamily)|nr:3-demethylubiquinone-9 3-methyltransferase [Fibrobacteria bacterium]